MAVVTQTIQDQVTELYLGFFNRAPDAAGFGYWTNQVANGGTTPQQLANQFAATPEFISNYSGRTPVEQVTKVYNNVLNRAPDTAGLNYWVAELNAGTSIGTVVWQIVNAAFTQVGTADGLLVQNKVTVGEYFALTLASNDATLAGTAYNSVTSVASSVVVAEQQLTQSVNAYTLTTGIDTITVPAGKFANVNAYIDSVTGTSDTTLQAFDTVTGSGANTGINLTVSGTTATAVADATKGASLSNIGTFSVRNTQATNTSGLVTLDATKVSGLTTVNSNLSTGDVTFSNLSNGTTVGVIGNGAIVNGVVKADYLATATTGSLALQGGVNGATNGAVTVTAGTGLTSFGISSVGGANVVKSVGLVNTVKTVNVNAQTNLDLGTGIAGVAAASTVNVVGPASAVILGSNALDAGITIVDASGLTAGGVTATLNAGVTSFKGGQGNDTVTSAALTATVAGEIDAGAGTGDRLIVATNTDINTATKGAEFVNFEILRTGAFSQSAALVAGVTALEMTTNGSAFTGVNAAQAQNITNLADNSSGTVVLTDASGTADVVSITLSNATTTASLTNFAIAGVETLNITDNAKTASTVSLGGTTSTGTGLKYITVAGTAGTTLDLDATGQTATHATSVLTISAANLTAQAAGTNTFTLQDTVGGHALTAGLVITGSNGDDAVSLGGTTGTDTIASGLVTINAGSGTDTFTASLAQLYTAGSGALAINGGAGTDTLTISNTTAGTVADASFANLTGVEKLTFADTSSMSLTAAASFNAAFGSAGTNGVTITATSVTGAATFAEDLTAFTGATSTSILGGTALTGALTMTGSAGADTVSVLSAGSAAGSVTVATKAGADVITITDAATAGANAVVSVDGGAGKDTITLTLGNASASYSVATVVESATESVVGSADTVSGFYVGAGTTRLADTIDFTGSAVKGNAVAATVVNGYTSGQLTFSVDASGKLAFAGTSAAALTASQVESIWTSQVSASIQNLGSVVWYDANALDTQYQNTLVFNHNTLGDTEVILVGVLGTSVATTAANTSGLVVIA